MTRYLRGEASASIRKKTYSKASYRAVGFYSQWDPAIVDIVFTWLYL